MEVGVRENIKKWERNRTQGIKTGEEKERKKKGKQKKENMG